MRSSLNFFALLAIAVASFGCQRPKNNGHLGENMDSLVTDKFNEWNDRDSSERRANPIKSGVIHMRSTRPIHGSDVERTIYFDDYGHKRYTETVTKMQVGDQTAATTQITLDVDGYSYKYDPEKKVGYRSKVNNAFNPTQIDFTRIDKMTMEDFGIKREGSEKVAGKDCIVYTIDYPAMTFKGRYAVWNNLPLREEANIGDFGYEYVATKLEENADVPESRFAVPAGIEFQDAAVPQPRQPDSGSGAAVDSMLQQALKQ